MQSPKMIFGLIALFAVILLGSTSLFIVQQHQLALLLRLGEIVDADYEPGLHLKLPLVQNVMIFDKRIQTLDSPPERYLTSEKKFVVVDSYVKWRIADVAQYFRSTRGSMGTTSRLLAERVNAALRDEFGRRTIQEVISGERSAIMKQLSKEADIAASDLGIEVVDVRVKQIDFPQEISNRIYDRMRTERERVARELRAEGAEAAERIRADADRQRVEIKADAYKQAELIRGEGDAKSAEVYANAFEKNAEFYAFWRSLKAYEQVFDKSGAMMVLDPNSEFFRYFNARKGDAK